MNPLAISSRPTDPKTGLEGRLSFSTQCDGAIDGAAYPAQFADRARRRPAVASLRRKIDVVGDESIARTRASSRDLPIHEVYGTGAARDRLDR